MSSTDTIGGKSIGFLERNGKLIAVITTSKVWSPKEIKTFLFTLLISPYMAQKLMLLW